MAEKNHELASGNHPHIESRHDDKEALFCLVHGGECGVVVEMHASEEEQKQLTESIQAAIERLDAFFDGHFVELFKGLEIEVGDGLTDGGAEAQGEDNRILLDREKMLMPVSEADALLAATGWAQEGDRLRAVPRELQDKPVAFLELIHEVGHIIEERADLHLPKDERLKRAEGLADKSPTHLYQQNPDMPHEAFAEGFAYMVLGQEVDDELRAVIERTVGDFKASRVV